MCMIAKIAKYGLVLEMGFCLSRPVYWIGATKLISFKKLFVIHLHTNWVILTFNQPSSL